MSCTKPKSFIVLYNGKFIRVYKETAADRAIDNLESENRRLKRQIEFLKTTHDSCGNCNKCADGMGKVFDENLDKLKGDYKEACDRLQTANLIKDENRKLKRALWLARAKAYRYIAELIACFNPDYVRNRKMFTPNNLKQKQMNSLKWARLMLKIERKCRAKAKEYK